jgi:hypothetical protein
MKLVIQEKEKEKKEKKGSELGKKGVRAYY